MSEEQKRTIADVQVGEQVAVRMRGEWQHWATVLRVTATQIVTDHPSTNVKEQRWVRATGREKGRSVGSFHWMEIALPTPSDEAWVSRLVALAHIERALREVRELPHYRWGRCPAEARAALVRMGEAAKECAALLAGKDEKA